MLNDKKAAKQIIKRAKKNPNWYTESDVYYAKMVKKRIKQEKRDAKQRLIEDQSEQ